MSQARRCFSVRRLLAAFVIGALVGLGAFEVSGYWQGEMYMGFCFPAIQSGFDLWTGQPHGATLTCYPNTVGMDAATAARQLNTTLVEPVPPGIASRRAVPVPVGFIVGAGLVLLVPAAQLAATRRRPRSPG